MPVFPFRFLILILLFWVTASISKVHAEVYENALWRKEFPLQGYGDQIRLKLWLSTHAGDTNDESEDYDWLYVQTWFRNRGMECFPSFWGDEEFNLRSLYPRKKYPQYVPLQSVTFLPLEIIVSEGEYPDNVVLRPHFREKPETPHQTEIQAPPDSDTTQNSSLLTRSLKASSSDQIVIELKDGRVLTSMGHLEPPPYNDMVLDTGEPSDDAHRKACGEMKRGMEETTIYSPNDLDLLFKTIDERRDEELKKFPGDDAWLRWNEKPKTNFSLVPVLNGGKKFSPYCIKGIYLWFQDRLISLDFNEDAVRKHRTKSQCDQDN